MELDVISLRQWWSLMRSPFAEGETEKKMREGEGDWDQEEWGVKETRFPWRWSFRILKIERWEMRESQWKKWEKKEEESLVKNIKYERWENLFYFMVYIYIYIYYLIKYCRAGGYPPDQNSKNRYPYIIRIFKISVSVSVSVHIYAHERASGSAGLVGRVVFHGFLPTLTF